MINGTTMMTGVGGLTLGDSWRMVKTAEIISAMGIEVLLGSVEPFHAKGHEVKPHPGQIQTAKNLRTLLESSNLVMKDMDLKSVQDKLRTDVQKNGDVLNSDISVQNVYSMRATPQVLGAVRDALTYVTQHVEIEMNSVNDNPLFFVDERMAYQGANFHGQPVALPFDVLSIALTQMGIISERRLNKMLDESRSAGLPPFLARNKAGLRCGFEGAQYIPTALIAECRTLCNPASIQSIPSNAENQDVVSMGLVAARKARDIGEKISYVLAVELLAIVEAAELRGVENMSDVGQAVYNHIRTTIDNFAEDRVMSGDITAVREMIVRGEILELATSIVGEL
jgi:histidine ammonia-lyase